MQSLHDSQEKLLKLLKKHETDPLTMRELQEELGLSSPSVVLHHIRQLEEKGYLRRNPSNPRDYQILADGKDKKIAYINLYGLAHCGPRGTCLDGDPVERIPISTKILGFSSAEAFLVRAKGKSMMPKIHPNDLVIGKRSNTAENGEVVVCVNDGEALIKRIQKSDKQIILVSENLEFKPFIASDDFRIEGIVRGVLSFKM
jgi:repressor LexA